MNSITALKATILISFLLAIPACSPELATFRPNQERPQSVDDTDGQQNRISQASDDDIALVEMSADQEQSIGELAGSGNVGSQILNDVRPMLYLIAAGMFIQVAGMAFVGFLVYILSYRVQKPRFEALRKTLSFPKNGDSS